MKGLKIISNNFNTKELKRYLFISIILIASLILISSFNFIQARYETKTAANFNPSIAFFIVDVGSQTGQIALENIVPRDEEYIYRFSVSNFNENKHADVDLKYNIEIITTTNLPLEMSVFSDENLENEIVDDETIEENKDGVYFKHLKMNGVHSMSYDEDVTDYYYLAVHFPSNYRWQPDEYSGMLELVDIKINAEQDVSV